MGIPRAVAVLFLGTAAGILAATLLGAALVREARQLQEVRSARIHALGTPAVPSARLLGSLGWKDDLAAGLFYGLSAGWPLGGLLSLMVLGLSLPRGAWIPMGAAGLGTAALGGFAGLPLWLGGFCAVESAALRRGRSLAWLLLGSGAWLIFLWVLGPSGPGVSAGRSEALPDSQVLGQLEVRDRILLNHAWGRSLTQAYYRHAPLALLPLASPGDLPQKLALVRVTSSSDARNFATYLESHGYRVDFGFPEETVEASLDRGEPQLLVAEFDGNRESPREALRRLTAGRSRLRRSTLLAAVPGSGGSQAGDPGGPPVMALPFTDRRVFEEILQGLGPRPFPALRFLIRIGSNPVLIAAGLGAAVLLSGWALVVSRRSPAARVATLLTYAGFLGCIGWALAGDLLPGPGQGEPLARLQALRDLAWSQEGKPLPSGRLDELRALADSPDPRLRREAVYTWGVLAMASPGDLRGTERLLSCLEDPGSPGDPRERQWAALALGFCGDSRAVPRLIRALEDPHYLVRHKAALALGSLRDSRAIGPLLRMTQEDAYWYNAACARAALARLGR